MQKTALLMYCHMQLVITLHQSHKSHINHMFSIPNSDILTRKKSNLYHLLLW